MFVPLIVLLSSISFIGFQRGMRTNSEIARNRFRFSARCGRGHAERREAAARCEQVVRNLPSDAPRRDRATESNPRVPTIARTAAA